MRTAREFSARTFDPRGFTPRRSGSRGERGIAIVTVMLLLLFTTSMLAGFLTVVSTDAKLRGVDRSRTRAFYAAHAALEKLTADLGDLFAEDFAPEPADLTDIESRPPEIENVTFEATDGLAYRVGYEADATGNPRSASGVVQSGPYQGFVALQTPYMLTVTSRMVDGSEARLQRTLQTVSIPVFQFGIFSETDLSFFAGPAFDFGGRVHSNGNLFLAGGNTLTLRDRVTAVGELIRTHLSNGWDTNSGYNGAVRAIRASGSFRNLEKTEGSLVTTLGSEQNEPTWTNISIGTYNGNLRNGRTGARRLDLPLVTIGGTPADLIRRPVAGEDPRLSRQRMFWQAGIRILLSGATDRITGLPSVSATAPLQLDDFVEELTPGGRPMALSLGDPTLGYRSVANTPLHGGFIKVEYRDNNDNWTDVTAEWLNLGFTRRNFDDATCTDATVNPNAILRMQRIKQNPAAGAPCGVASTAGTDHWPLILYDAREAWPRDTHITTATEIHTAGIMHYVDLDVNNLRRWLAGEIGASGPNVVNEDGYTVYFSDRRGNRDAAGNETGELGFEDWVNPGDVTWGTPNGILEAGEDVNSNNQLDTYGNWSVANDVWAQAPLNSAATITTGFDNGAGQDTAMNRARSNRAVFFRRALKVTNGALGNLPVDGLTIVSENPVYVQGNYNANAGGFGNPHAAAAVMGDAVTLLSNAWSDTRSFQVPWNADQRNATTTWYRMAIISGKGRSFPHIGSLYQDYGTDGGTHNFLRYLEDWGGQTLYYRGSLVSFYYSRQAVGIYKCCSTVYKPPTRGYNFDTEFLTPALLPPKTPMFRDLNTTGFIQLTRRTQQ